ncbi:ferritin-like domain-containing protein [Hymenobacter psychrotolerans]|uniref:Ferritin-like domain-containing protein n=1 Tax=Hymenobacter psychrotolerans DSM 18569 TaxID=1121959 RepID=A0A1M6RUP1_9BACT|nr:ferritin-like domain-containing protein [Hymenobacter psychrotolerans]SHK36211.1 Ferritin-like domain-containing protein [Hymenobacter psychrotolerans DSM 18569]
MNILKLLAELAEINPNQLEQSAPRREALENLSRFGAKALAAALPFGLAALPAQARTTLTILDSLNLFLQIERLQEALYSRALALTVPFFPADPTFRASVAAMQRHQQQHIVLLTDAITSSGSTAIAAPNFDFTGTKNGTQPALFANVFTDFDQFLQVAQLLEDAAVRAYKGQVEFLNNAFIVQTVLQLHATEARHAARIRLMRKQRGATVKPWPSPTDASITVAGKTDVVYEGEDALKQYLSNTRPVPFQLLPIGYPGTNILTQGVPEAFDEPLNTDQTQAVLALFSY